MESDFDFLELNISLVLPQVICHNARYVLWLDGWVETDHFKVIVIKRDQILSPPALLYLDHSIAFVLNLVIGNDLVAVTQQL